MITLHNPQNIMGTFLIVFPFNLSHFFSQQGAGLCVSRTRALMHAQRQRLNVHISTVFWLDSSSEAVTDFHSRVSLASAPL